MNPETLKKFAPLLLVIGAFGYFVHTKMRQATAIDYDQVHADASVMAALSTMQAVEPKPSPEPAGPRLLPKLIPNVGLAIYESETAAAEVKAATNEVELATPEAAPAKRYKPYEASVVVTSRKAADVYQCSGTAVESNTVLTCAHVVRDGYDLAIDGKPAKLATIDRTADLALIRTEHELKPAPIAKLGPKYGDAVTAWGYQWDYQGKLMGFPGFVSWLNRYSGPDNLLVRGNPPKSGRSGGGLFNTSGELVGVCSANDKPDKKKRTEDGLYTGIQAVHKLLDPSYKPPAIDHSKHVTPQEANALFPRKTRAK